VGGQAIETLTLLNQPAGGQAVKRFPNFKNNLQLSTFNLKKR